MEVDKNLIATEWDKFSNMVIPKDAPDIQYAEMKLSFYAGYRSLLSSMMRFTDSSEEITDSYLKQMEYIEKELDEFYESKLKDLGITIIRL